MTEDDFARVKPVFNGVAADRNAIRAVLRRARLRKLRRFRPRLMRALAARCVREVMALARKVMR